MHLTNLSQLLVRNDDLLAAKFPLLINMPNDELAQYMQTLNTETQLTFYDTNFEQHNYHQQITDCSCIFAAQLHTEQIHDLVILRFPKSKNELTFTLAMLAHCTTATTKLLVVGENKSGIKSVNKLIAKQVSFCEKVDAARHCLLFEAALTNHGDLFNLEDWYSYYSVELNKSTFKVAALPGVFSQAKLDMGTAILLENLPNTIEGRVLDFGCGAGVIATYIGLTNRNTELHLADVSALALASSAKTLELNNLYGKTFATNSLSHITEQYQHVISNPPFHQGIATHYAATETFLDGVKKHLTKQGILTIVANSFLKYQPIIERSIGKTVKLCVKSGFTIYQTRISR